MLTQGEKQPAPLRGAGLPSRLNSVVVSVFSSLSVYLVRRCVRVPVHNGVVVACFELQVMHTVPLGLPKCFLGAGGILPCQVSQKSPIRHCRLGCNP